ncbi:MAG: glycosyltransferase family 39 protein, partial [Planctomycetes bacterium]|nr:glycosyltransferase family 39 protein [Planctomycetota bacterium]
MTDPLDPAFRPVRPTAWHTLLFCLGFVLMAGYLFLRSLNFPPEIFPDVMYYSFAIRKLPFSQVAFPNYLYYFVYGIIGWFDDFLLVAKGLNAFFYTASGFFIFRLARMVCDTTTAVLVVLLSLLLPVSTLTLFLLPESMYQFVFWAIVWYLVRYWDSGSLRFWFTAGALIGGLSLVKVHGLFLLPALALVILFSDGVALQSLFSKQKAKAILLTSAGFLLVKWGMGFLFAGPAGINLLGTAYTSFALEKWNSDAILLFLQHCCTMLWAHLMAVCVLVGLPLVVSLRFVAIPDPAAAIHRRLSLLALAIFSVLVVVSSLFSALLGLYDTGGSGLEPVTIQSRYYFFVYPAFLILAGGEATRHLAAGLRQLPFRILDLVVFLVAICAVTGQLDGYELIKFPHCPEFYALFRNHIWIAMPLGCLFLAPLAAWCGGRFRWAARWYFYCAVPVYVIISCFGFHGMISRHSARTDSFALAAAAVRDLVGDEITDVAVFSQHQKFGSFYLYHSDEPEVEWHYGFAPGLVVDAREQRRSWGVLIGDVRAIHTSSQVTLMKTMDVNDTVTLVRFADSDFSVDFSADRHGWPVQRVSDDGDELAVSYRLPLPPVFFVRLEALAGYAGGGALDVSFVDGDPVTLTPVAAGEPAAEAIVRSDKPDRTLWLRDPEN